jgi:hypothetical protein
MDACLQTEEFVAYFLKNWPKQKECPVTGSLKAGLRLETSTA